LEGVERGKHNPSVKQLVKNAQALGVESHELLTVAQEEPSAAMLQAMIQELLRQADRGELQLAY